MVGIPTGHVSGIKDNIYGIMVLDIDVKDGANPYERLANFEALIGAAFPRNFVVNTPSGGLHVYMAMPPHADIRSGTRTLGQEGVDIRANGGYVVAAGSIRADGRAYTLVTEVGHA